MDILKRYNIDVFNLSNSNHEYEFVVDEVFFKYFNNSLIENGRATIRVSLKKSDSFIEIQFQIKGEIELTCDRSLEKFTESIECKNNMLFKYGEKREELSDEIVMIARDEQRINIGQFIYEFIYLTMPMKKIHPKLRHQDDEGIIYSSSKEEDTNNINDPRWDKLKGLIK